MSGSWTDWLSEHLQDREIRAEFGAEGLRTSFALALLNARERVGMTQSELADVCGVSQAYISRLESGEANPTIGKIGAIFAAMWMEPTVGFELLMSERPNAVPVDAKSQQPAERASVLRPAPPADTALAGGRRPQTVPVND